MVVRRKKPIAEEVEEIPEEAEDEAPQPVQQQAASTNQLHERLDMLEGTLNRALQHLHLIRGSI